ncbi:MAG TPA: zinc-binding alcohol dehydrogenase family protein [Noviherbaspirillum sp.]|jgi:zinc-binding alcohol dehydrogenase family protein|uniref:zinc-binding alcohol dehydrogenase family protein n=1 Tax=Noviherbaspirillum sp. TaxID=1926288 RepID=UPI002F93192D
MKAIALTHYPDWEDPAGLFETDLPMPVPRERDVLVAVQAVSVNPVDNRARAPKEAVEAAPRVLGWDAAGIVVAAGAGVTRFRPGDRVYYAGEYTRAGSYAEYQLVHEDLVGSMPMVSFAAAAAMPLTVLTAWEAIFDRLRVPRAGAGERKKSMLIVGAGGGVGSIATQIAARVAGLTVIGTASNERSRQWCLEMGASAVVDHGKPLVPQVRVALGRDEVDYILLAASADLYFGDAAELVAPQGAICTLVEAKRPIDFGLLWDKSVTLTWEMVFTRALFRTEDMHRQGQILSEVAGLIDAGVLETTETEVLRPICPAQVLAALNRLRKGSVCGKIVLEQFDNQEQRGREAEASVSTGAGGEKHE